MRGHKRFQYTQTLDIKMKTLLLLLTLSSLLPVLTPQAAWANPRAPKAGEQFLAQIEPPSPSGSCLNQSSAMIQDCYEEVQWENLGSPARNVYHLGDYIYQWVGINTISRNGDAINFDHYDDFAGYVRLSANCRTRVYSTVLASNHGVDPDNYHPVGDFWGRALDFACSVSD
jgi:hypothetical protein